MQSFRNAAFCTTVEELGAMRPNLSKNAAAAIVAAAHRAAYGKRMPRCLYTLEKRAPGAVVNLVVLLNAQSPGTVEHCNLSPTHTLWRREGKGGRVQYEAMCDACYTPTIVHLGETVRGHRAFRKVLGTLEKKHPGGVICILSAIGLRVVPAYALSTPTLGRGQYVRGGPARRMITFNELATRRWADLHADEYGTQQ